jgi:hypothetical protein
MSNEALPHSYLFVAVFKDGSEIEQTQEDVSKLVAGKSTFYDVQQRQDELAYFYLRNHEKTYMVDLENKSLEVAGVPITTEGLELFNVRLIYFHRNKAHFNILQEEIGREREYHIGFQANYYENSEIKNFKQEMVVK